jgi:hypothetical protein
MRLNTRALSAALIAMALSACDAAPAIDSARASPAPGAATAATAENPTVVEIFQSQGCSSCPAANANVNAVADNPRLLALSFAVTYWDQLGWKDRFAKPAFTQRQRDYAAHARRNGVYTPQVIVNGRQALVGRDRAQFDAAIARAGRPLGGPTISASAGEVTIGADASGSNVWLVRYDPRSRDVPIAAGENSGRTLPHRHIVTDLTKLGTTGKTAMQFALPKLGGDGLSAAILVQRANGGPITAARRIQGRF